MPVIQVEVTDSTYQLLASAADTENSTVEEVAAARLASNGGVGSGKIAEVDRGAKAARERLLSFIGTIDCGGVNAADNEGIDRDLADEYGRGLSDS